MRIPFRTTITFIFFLYIASGNQSTAFHKHNTGPHPSINETDAFSKSERNLKDLLIFSDLLGSDVKTIVLDAGHGGKDRGCKGIHPDTKEKEIALAVTLKLGNYIESYFPDVNVIYTRKEDKFVTLNRRARIANEAKADLFISIHCNYIRNRPDVFGSETYVMGLHTADHNLNVAMRENASITLEDNFKRGYQGYDPNSTESHIMLSMYQNAYLERSILFAELVEQQIPKSSNGKHSSRGVRQAGFLVLKETAMPSVLVESGYLSHERDEGYLRTKEGQKDVAFAIFKAFSIYKNVIEGTEEGEVKMAALDVAVMEEKSEEMAKATTPVESAPSKTEEPIINKAPAKKIATTPATAADEEAVYLIQIAATTSPIDLKRKKYAPLADVIISKKEGKYLKFFVPAGTTYSQASKMLAELKSADHPYAFITLYQGDKRIKMQYK